MKKALLLVVLFVVLVSCGKKGDPYPKNSLHDSVKSEAPEKR